MNFTDTKKKVQHWVEEIDKVEYTDSFDDMKDVELLESFITEEIFDYCREKNYDVEGFPFVQLEKIEQGELGYDEDFMTYNRFNLYIYKLALDKDDVLQLCSLNLFFKGWEKRAVWEEIKGTVLMMEEDGVSFDLTEEELEFFTKTDKPYRPKLP